MNVFKNIAVLLFALPVLPAVAQYVPAAYISEIKSLQTTVDGKFDTLPVIALGSEQTLNIGFDYLSNEEQFLSYRIVHCDAGWQADDLSELDYLEGFLPQKMDDGRASFNTFCSYYHYSLTLPNDEVQPTVSGNYKVLFYYEGMEEELPIAEAPFSVSENIAFVKGEVSGNTDVDFQAIHQQLSLDLSWSNAQLPYLNPVSDLKVMVSQNHQSESVRQLKSPLRFEANHAYYEHDRQLIFEGGNHWRRFEYINERYTGLRVDRLRYEVPLGKLGELAQQKLYHAYLFTDNYRGEGGYFYDQDQHGRYLLNSKNVDDATVEGDYFVAVFTLKAPARFANQHLAIEGDLANGPSDDYVMEYDAQNGMFYKELLLKQGHYNYRYSVTEVEGNHFETPNEYEVYVYYRPFDGRYDRLLGVGVIR